MCKHFVSGFHYSLSTTGFIENLYLHQIFLTGIRDVISTVSMKGTPISTLDKFTVICQYVTNYGSYVRLFM